MPPTHHFQRTYLMQFYSIKNTSSYPITRTLCGEIFIHILKKAFLLENLLIVIYSIFHQTLSQSTLFLYLMSEIDWC